MMDLGPFSPSLLSLGLSFLGQTTGSVSTLRARSVTRRRDMAPMAEVLGAGSRIVGSHFVVSRSKGCPGLTI